MNEISTLRTQVQAILRNWNGYPILVEVMEGLPELEVYLAGGVIRNLILGRNVKSKDFDLFLAGPVESALTQLSANGKVSIGPWGTPHWFPAHHCSTYADLAAISGFDNGLWPCEDIVDALNQFDFTGNAVAFDLRSGVFYDPQNGYRDLRRRLLRAVRFDFPEGPMVPGHALPRNVVHWFRMVHYAAALELEIEPITLRWLREHRTYANFRERFATTFFEPHSAALFLGTSEFRDGSD